MKREIKCAACGKLLFDTEKSDGASMSEAQGMGFVAKMPFLYGISGCFFFCNKECHEEWSKVNISQEAKAIGDKSIIELKAKQPQMVEDTVKAFARFTEVLNKIRKK